MHESTPARFEQILLAILFIPLNVVVVGHFFESRSNLWCDGKNKACRVYTLCSIRSIQILCFQKVCVVYKSVGWFLFKWKIQLFVCRTITSQIIISVCTNTPRQIWKLIYIFTFIQNAVSVTQAWHCRRFSRAVFVMNFESNFNLLSLLANMKFFSQFFNEHQIWKEAKSFSCSDLLTSHHQSLIRVNQ